MVKINDEALGNGITDPEFNLLLHSAGNFVGNNACTSIKSTHPEICAHTNIYSIGTPIIIDDNLVRYVDTKISSRDGVGYLGLLHGCLTNPSHQNFSIVPSWGGFPLCDHPVLGDTYREELGAIFRQIQTDRKK